MRNALILLVIVALALLVVAALNSDTVVDIAYLAGTWEDVSLVLIAGVVGAVVIVAGLAAVWLAMSGASATRRRLETELQSTYQRLRAAEGELARRVEAAPAAAEPPGEAAPGEAAPRSPATEAAEPAEQAGAAPDAAGEPAAEAGDAEPPVGSDAEPASRERQSDA